MVDVMIPTSTEWGTTMVSLYEAYYGQGDSNEKKGPSPQKSRKQDCNLRSLLPQLRKQSVCVAGLHRDSIQEVKAKLVSLQEEPFALESFHVKKPSDIEDGAFLSPKIVLVGIHSPGRKILDDENDEGQLDFLYDEACRLGADIMVMYVGLPKRVYTPMRSAYHPKIAETIFPQQKLIKRLASDNCFMTLSEGSNLNNIQSNMLREWLGMPSHMEEYLFSAGEEEKVIFEIKSETQKLAGPSWGATAKPDNNEPPPEEEKKKKKVHRVKKDPSKRKRKVKYTFEKEEDVIEEESLMPDVQIDSPHIEMDMYRSVPIPKKSPGVLKYSYDQV